MRVVEHLQSECSGIVRLLRIITLRAASFHKELRA
jgi:hypothetical protein